MVLSFRMYVLGIICVPYKNARTPDPVLEPNQKERTTSENKTHINQAR